MSPLEKLRNLIEICLDVLQSNDPLRDPSKTGPALLVSDCSLGEYGDLGDNSLDDFVDEWVPTVHDDQGEALEPRIVDRLAADEHDAEWISDYGTHWKWDNGRWWHTEPGGGRGIWVATPYGFIPDSSGPFTEAIAQPLSWRGWAVPAILEVLADDVYSAHYVDYDDWVEWAEHVAPILADRIACDPQRAMEALRNHQPDKVTR